MSVASETVVTWIKLESPRLDVVSLLLSALTLTGVLVLSALALGVLFGVATIMRQRHAAHRWRTSLHLDLYTPRQTVP